MSARHSLAASYASVAIHLLAPFANLPDTGQPARPLAIGIGSKGLRAGASHYSATTSETREPNLRQQTGDIGFCQYLLPNIEDLGHRLAVSRGFHEISCQDPHHCRSCTQSRREPRETKDRGGATLIHGGNNCDIWRGKRARSAVACPKTVTQRLGIATRSASFGGFTGRLDTD